jgi:hypothetical protein
MNLYVSIRYYKSCREKHLVVGSIKIFNEITGMLVQQDKEIKKIGVYEYFGHTISVANLMFCKGKILRILRKLFL